MDPIVTVLFTTAAGALVGTLVGVLLMRRQLRPPVTETELAELKANVQRSETSLAAATSHAEDLGKQLAQQDKTIKQAREDLKQKQQQLDLLLSEAQSETVKRSAAEQRVQELVAQTGVLTEQHTKLDTKASEQEKQLAEKSTQIAALQGELDAGKRHAEELKEQNARVTAEAAELRSSREQEGRYRSSLEGQLKTEKEQIGHLTTKMAELQTERAQLEIRLQEERRTAAKGMEELLKMAQEKLAGLFQPASLDGQSANGDKASVTPSEVIGEIHAKAASAQPKA